MCKRKNLDYLSKLNMIRIDYLPVVGILKKLVSCFSSQQHNRIELSANHTESHFIQHVQKSSNAREFFRLYEIWYVVLFEQLNWLYL